MRKPTNNFRTISEMWTQYSEHYLFSSVLFTCQLFVAILLLLQLNAKAATAPQPLRLRRSFGWSSWSLFSSSGDSVDDVDNHLAAVTVIPIPTSNTTTGPTSTDLSADDDSDLPAELLNLARSFGVRHFERLPRLAEAQALLGTASAAETVQAVREIATSEEGAELIRQFLASGDYYDGTDAQVTSPAATTTTTTTTTVAPAVGWLGTFAQLFYGKTTAAPATTAASVASDTVSTRPLSPSVQSAAGAVLMRPLVAVPAVLVHQQQKQQLSTNARLVRGPAVTAVPVVSIPNTDTLYDQMCRDDGIVRTDTNPFHQCWHYFCDKQKL